MTKPLLFFLLLAIVFVPGCAEPTEGEVSGTVIVDGEPANGSIGFIPVDGLSSTSGAAIKDGEYTAIVPLGEMKVQIRANKKVGETRIYNTPDSPIQTILAEVLPPKYNDETELLLVVKPGKNQKDYDLRSK